MCCYYLQNINIRCVSLHSSSVSIFFALLKEYMLSSVATAVYSEKSRPCFSCGSKKCTKGLYNSRRRFLLPPVKQLITYPNIMARTVPRSVFKYCDNLNNMNGSAGESLGLKYMFNWQQKRKKNITRCLATFLAD